MTIGTGSTTHAAINATIVIVTSPDEKPVAAAATKSATADSSAP